MIGMILSGHVGIPIKQAVFHGFQLVAQLDYARFLCCHSLSIPGMLMTEMHGLGRGKRCIRFFFFYGSASCTCSCYSYIAVVSLYHLLLWGFCKWQPCYMQCFWFLINVMDDHYRPTSRYGGVYKHINRWLYMSILLYIYCVYIYIWALSYKKKLDQHDIWVPLACVFPFLLVAGPQLNCSSTARQRKVCARVLIVQLGRCQKPGSRWFWEKAFRKKPIYTHV